MPVTTERARKAAIGALMPYKLKIYSKDSEWPYKTISYYTVEALTSDVNDIGRSLADGDYMVIEGLPT